MKSASQTSLVPSNVKGNSKASTRFSLDMKTSFNKNIKLSTDSNSLKLNGNKQKKYSEMNKLIKLLSSQKSRQVASKTDSNFTRRKTHLKKNNNTLPNCSHVEENALKPKHILSKSSKICLDIIETSKNELKSILDRSINLGTPNTVKIPPLSKALHRRCLTDHNGRMLKQKSLHSTNYENDHLNKRKEIHGCLQKEEKLTVPNRHNRCLSTVETYSNLIVNEELAVLHKTISHDKLLVLSTAKLREDNQAVVMPEEAIGNTHYENPVTQEQLESVIDECSILLDTGCPANNILPWLSEIQEKIPLSLKSANFWLVKARAHLLNKDFDKLLEVFSNAVKYEATPADIIAESLPKMIKEAVPSSEVISEDEYPYSPSQSPFCMDTILEYDVDDYLYSTPVPAASQGMYKNVIETSAIRYSVQKTTPFKNSFYNIEDCLTLVTPVRRSTRRSAVLIRNPHTDSTINSIDKVIVEDKVHVLIKDNTALDGFN